MGTPKISIWISKIALLLAVVLVVAAIGVGSNRKSDVESLVTEKMADYLSEEEFWGFLPETTGDLKVVLFVATDYVIDNANASDFDVLAIVPEVNLTLEMRKCEEEPAIVVQGWGASKDAKKEPSEYLRNQIQSLSNFVSHARRYETLVPITSDPVKLFNVERALRTKRIEQITSVLRELIPQRPLTVRVAYFTRSADNIDVLVPSFGRMYTMGVAHKCSGEDSVVHGRETRLKMVRPDLRKKIEKYSTLEVIR